MRNYLAIALLLFWLVPQNAGAADEPSAVQSLNNTFISIYEHERERYVQRDFPVIILRRGNIILYRSGKRDERSGRSTEWQDLKTVDHVPLAIYVLLHDRVDTDLGEYEKQSLQLLRSKIELAMPEIQHEPFATGVSARQQSILTDSQKFIDIALRKGSVRKEELTEFISTMSRLSMENADDAESLELSRLEAVLHEWKQQMSSQEWTNLHVVVCGSHMARQMDHYTQYFLALFKESSEGGRVVFMEGLDDEQKALELLATHQLDSAIAVSYFSDKDRMHRDLLSDGAKKYLQEHKPSP